MEILLTPVTELHCTVSRTSSTPGPGCSLSAVTRDKNLASEKKKKYFHPEVILGVELQYLIVTTGLTLQEPYYDVFPLQKPCT